MRTDADVLTSDTEMDTNAPAVLKARAGQKGWGCVSPARLSHLLSPGPACVNLDHLRVCSFGPQEPTVASVL